VDGQVRLRPFTLLPQLANSLAQADTNIGCHQAIMAVFFRLHFAYRIQSYPVLLGGRFGSQLDSKTKGSCWPWHGSGGRHRRGSYQAFNLPRKLAALAVAAEALGRGVRVGVIYMVALAYTARHRRFLKLLLCNHKRGSRTRRLVDDAPAANPKKSYTRTH
jgi:hypothetical protein